MTKINEDNIRVAAYYIWEQAGRPEGAEKECWIKACEQLFAAKPAKKTAAKKTTSAKVAATPAAKSAAKKAAAKPAAKAAKPAVSAAPFYGVKKK